MGLHRLHRETNLELKPQCYRDGLLDTTITLYNAEYGDGRRAGGDSKVLARSCRNDEQRETDIRTMITLTH